MNIDPREYINERFEQHERWLDSRLKPIDEHVKDKRAHPRFINKATLSALVVLLGGIATALSGRHL